MMDAAITIVEVKRSCDCRLQIRPNFNAGMSRVPGSMKESAGAKRATAHCRRRGPSGKVRGQGDGVGCGGGKSEVGYGQFGLSAAHKRVVGEV